MRRLSFIVADDDDILREAMASILRSLGGRVRSARDGQELLSMLSAALAHGEPIDLVITDLRMPKATGLQILDTARGLGLDIPFLIVTGWRRPEVHTHVAARGASILPKPFTTGDFLARVRKLCGLDAGPGGGSPIRA